MVKLQDKPRAIWQFALDIAQKDKVPYAAQVLYNKSKEITSEWNRINKLFPGNSKNEELKEVLSKLAKLSRECEKSAELIIIGI